MEKKYPFQTMSVEEMAAAVNATVEEAPDMTEEELIEYDAEYGYFDDLEDYQEED